MDAFLEEDGYNEFIKEEEEKKKEAEKAASGEKMANSFMWGFPEDAVKKEDRPDEAMEGTIQMQKTKLENRNSSDLVHSLVSGVGDFSDIFANKLFSRQSFFAIKKGVLYQYENQKSRQASEMFQINKISAISVMKEAESKKFQMIYENFYFIMECQDHWSCRKWVNSIKHV